MAKTGLPEDPPLAAGAAVADTNGALALATSVLAALFVRERTGQGQKVGASIYGTVIAMQAFELAFASFSGKEPQRAGRAHQLLHGVWGAFRTKDGWLCLAGVDDKRWPRFCAILGIEHLEGRSGVRQPDPQLLRRAEDPEGARRDLPDAHHQGVARRAERGGHPGDAGRLRTRTFSRASKRG